MHYYVLSSHDKGNLHTSLHIPTDIIFTQCEQNVHLRLLPLNINMYICNISGKRFVVWFTHKARTVYFKYLMYYKSVNWTFFLSSAFGMCLNRTKKKKKSNEHRELHIHIIHVLDVLKNINSCGNSFVLPTLSSLWIYSGALALLYRHL